MSDTVLASTVADGLTTVPDAGPRHNVRDVSQSSWFRSGRAILVRTDNPPIVETLSLSVSATSSPGRVSRIHQVGPTRVELRAIRDLGETIRHHVRIRRQHEFSTTVQVSVAREVYPPLEVHAMFRDTWILDDVVRGLIVGDDDYLLRHSKHVLVDVVYKDRLLERLYDDIEFGVT